LQRTQRNPQNEVRLYWEGMQTRILNSCRDRILTLAPTHFGTCFDAFAERLVSVAEVFQWYGPGGIFRPCARPLTASYEPSIASSTLFGGRIDMQETIEIGDTLLTFRPPWLSMSELSIIDLDEGLREFSYMLNVPYRLFATFRHYGSAHFFRHSSLFFGVIAMFAVEIELVLLLERFGADRALIEMEHGLARDKEIYQAEPLLRVIRSMIISRALRSKHPRVQSRFLERMRDILNRQPTQHGDFEVDHELQHELEAARLSNQQRALIFGWARGEFNFVE
jgi:hypothetical protein